MTTTAIRVAVVDDDTVLREGLPMLLAEGIHVTATARSVHEFVTRARALGPIDVVVLDLNLNGRGDSTDALNGRRAIESLTATGRRCLIYTSERRRHVLVGCYLSGARGVVHKTEPLAHLEAGIHLVANGGIAVTSAVAGLVELVSRRGSLPTLTDRQKEVLRARARGESFPSIASRLGISPKTAEEHMTVVAKKFAEVLAGSTPAQLQHELGLGPGDVMA